MNASGLKIGASVCCCLFVFSLSSFAQTSDQTTAAFPNRAAIDFSQEVPAQWRQALDLPASLSGVEAREQASADFLSGKFALPHRNAGTLLQGDTDLFLAQAETNGQQQPTSNNEPSLKDLGFPSSAIQGSSKEQELLNKRSHMLQIHQKLGLLTTIPMIATVFTGPGAKGHHGLPGSPTGREVHMGLGILTTGMYFSSAYFAIRAPKIPETKSYGLIRLHKAMAWIHGPGMILTPILGAIAYSQISRGERVHGIAKYHSWVAYTTVGAYGVAILSVTLK